MSNRSKYVITYGKFGRHENAAGEPVGPEHGGQLVIKRPGDIIELTPAEAQSKHDSVRLANSEEIAAYEERIASGAPQPTPVNRAAQGPPRPLAATDGVQLAEPVPPAGKPATQPAKPAATALAPQPPARAAAAPAVPAAAPAAAAPAAPAAGKPKARSGGKKKAATK